MSAKYTVQFYKDRKKEWRWRLIARNGHKVANAGEGYQRRAACHRIAWHLFSSLDGVVWEE